MIGSFRRGLVVFALGSTLVLAFPLIARAASGDLDSTFSGDGMQTTDMGAFDEGRTVARLASGKLLVLAHTGNDVGLIRYTNGGIPDPSFGGGDGSVTASLLGDEQPYNGLVVLPSGKILVAAWTKGTGDVKLGLFRFTANGDPDSTFGGGDGKLSVGFGHDFFAYDMAVLGSGKMLVAGEFDPASLDGKFLVARLNANGSKDTTFGGGDGFVTTQFGTGFDGAWSLVVDSSGRIVAGGWAEEGISASAYDVALARYTPAGAPDHTFSGDGKLITQVYQGDDDYAFGLALQGSKIVAGVHAHDGAINPVVLIRYQSSGKLDPTFGGGDGEVITGQQGKVADIAVDSSNRIVVAGSTSSQLFAARYKSSGALDTGFGTNGFSVASFSSPSFANGITLATGGKIVVVGGSNGNVVVARFLP